jgi:hypothetical protein
LVQSYNGNQWFLNGGNFGPRGYLAMLEDKFDHYNRGDDTIESESPPNKELSDFGAEI